jgi:anti-anti-sigma regulatory factor
MQQQRRLIFCEVNNQVWGIFLVTGLDKIFDFTNDIATALASVQLGPAGGGAKSAKR